MNIAQRITSSFAFLAAAVTLAVVSSNAVTRAADDATPSAAVSTPQVSPAEKEKDLLEKLRTAPDPDKAIACKELSVYGSAQAVPALAPLLADERLASWSRIALEAIPGPEASEALRKALDTVQGRLLVGTINSIGVRRDEAAVEPLAARVKDADADVASAAAVALGHIGNPAATQTLRKALVTTPAKVRNAAAEGCILCAEKLLRDGKINEAVEIYDEVRRADLPKQKVIEATRGAILARKSDGIPLLVEQLKSEDPKFFRLGLGAARELTGRDVTEALLSEVGRATPERAALVLVASAERSDFGITPTLLEAAEKGPKPVRIAALGIVGRLGDEGSVVPLLKAASDGDAEVAQAAKAALVALRGEKTNAAIVARLSGAESQSLAVLLDLIGQRRIEATEALLSAIDHADPQVRTAALTALGETVGQKDLKLLISQAIAPKHAGDAETAQKALRAACVRMPEREVCAAEVIQAMPGAPQPTRPVLLEILGQVAGEKALAAIGDAVKGNDAVLQDTGSRVLGEWMTLDAAPVLLDLAKSAPSEKYQGRAFRGYLRLARQFAGGDQKRAEMCQAALDASPKAAEQQLVLAVLEKYPSREGLDVAIKACQKADLKENASRTSLAIVQKLGAKAGDVPALVAQMNLDPMKVEIIKAEYGAGTTLKDVTETLQKQAGDKPLISLPSASYTESFGGDPVPGTPKTLKVQYRINGKQGEASFADDAIVMLPMPQ